MALQVISNRKRQDKTPVPLIKVLWKQEDLVSVERFSRALRIGPKGG